MPQTPFTLYDLLSGKVAMCKLKPKLYGGEGQSSSYIADQNKQEGQGGFWRACLEKKNFSPPSPFFFFWFLPLLPLQEIWLEDYAAKCSYLLILVPL